MNEAAKKSIRGKLKVIRNMSASAECRELCDVIDELMKAIDSPPPAEDKESGFHAKPVKARKASTKVTQPKSQ